MKAASHGRWRRLGLVAAAVTATGLGYSSWQITRYDKGIQNKYPNASLHNPWQVTVLRVIPNRVLSRFTGYVSELTIPVSIRPSLYRNWAALVGAKLEEIAVQDLSAYANLGEFFVRRLRAEARPIDMDASKMVSPCDGYVVTCKPADSRTLEQIKGAAYDLNAFLGEPDTDSTLFSTRKDKNTRLYQCVIYLSPKDYHRFHSPTDWQIQKLRHFPGELLSVNPGLTRIAQNLFVLNERVTLLGSWRHGFFSITAVGATNVGSISLTLDPELRTNDPKAILDGNFQEKPLAKKVAKGAEVGAFHLGSTIVLLFEAPLDFEFTIKEGQHVRFGESIALV